jgi:YtfJ family uncharacterized protein
MAAAGQGLEVGRKLPGLEIVNGGAMVPATVVVNDRMTLAGKALGYRPWASREMTGRVWTLYHSAARLGVFGLNQAYLKALAAAQLPEFAIDSPYKTVVILNAEDALWPAAALRLIDLEKRQRQAPYAIHVIDNEGVAAAAWDFQGQTSSVAVVDRDGTVRFFKEGRLSKGDIDRALGIIKDRLAY